MGIGYIMEKQEDILFLTLSLSEMQFTIFPWSELLLKQQKWKMICIFFSSVEDTSDKLSMIQKALWPVYYKSHM